MIDAAERVDSAAATVRALPDDAARTAALELVSAIEEFHKPALVAIVKALRADPRGKELLFELVDDPDVRAVFALHGIIKADPVTRALRALDTVRPYLQSHGGDVELVELRGSTAVVKLLGSCNGCSMSAVTLREGVEEALVNGVDEITAIEVLENAPTPAFIPVESLGRKRSTGWVAGPSTSEVPLGGMLRFDVDDHSFVITNIEHRFAVFRNACVHQGMTLDGGMIDDGVIVCPWHGFRFEASTGECISAPGAQLTPMPTRIDDDRVWVRVRAD